MTKKKAKANLPVTLFPKSKMNKTGITGGSKAVV